MSDELERLRRDRQAAVGARARAAARARQGEAALERAKRRGAGGREVGRLAAEHKRALEDLARARAGERQALREIGSRAASGSPVERIGQLDATCPIAFFPVRLETRFRRSAGGDLGQPAGELLVRVFPDGLLAQTHEPLLSEDEVELGEDFWSRLFEGGEESEAWALLLGETDAERAAWIVERTTPENLDRLEDGKEGVSPTFPRREVRPAGWHRAPEAPTLPDRWVLSAHRDGAQPRRVFSRPVREGLALTLRLSGDGDDEGLAESFDLSGDGLEIDPELRWAYDFEEAVEAGMAVRMPLSRAELEQGFSKLLAFGVRTTASPATQAGELEALLDGHRFSRGLAFVPQGTQTNNSADAPSAHPPADPGGAASLALARGAPRAKPGTDGHRFARALGVEPASADRLAGAERDEQGPARAMADALWPVTAGYFLTQIMTPEVSRESRDALREHVRDHLRPRGHLPAFRVGATPYGLLPVGSLARWRAAPGEKDDPLAARLPASLRRLAETWSRASGASPRIGRSDDPDADLIATLAQDASARVARLRRCFGPDTVWNVLEFLGLQEAEPRTAQQQVAKRVLEELGLHGDPRVLRLSFDDKAFRFSGPLVQAPPLSETEPLGFDYIAWLRAAPLSELRDQPAPPSEQPVDALLYAMLRHALLTEYDEAAMEILESRGLLSTSERFEAELVGVGAEQAGQGKVAERTAWDRFEMHLPDVTGDLQLGPFLADPRSSRQTVAPRAKAVLTGLDAYRQDLRSLEGLPSAELERLFAETLDAYSHRLDPWIGSLFAQRLDSMRAARPRGTYLACYGWVEDLVADPPAERVRVRGRDGKTELARTDSGGYVYAPSMLHGATAAVLRSAYLTREDETLAVDLSSRRVREALRLLDSVRADQPLGAALGYGFERGLHEGHPGLELDRFIDAFRADYPLVANKADASDQPAESVAARNVVDGLELREAWRAGTIAWGSGGLTPDAAQRAAIERQLGQLDEHVDSLADLLVAESVHQVLRGSPQGAAASLDSLAKGHRAPEPEVATTPRGGGVLHQRVALVLGATDLPAAWAAIEATPRAKASPELNAWLGELLGDPDEIGCAVSRQGGPATTVTAAKLGLHPLDLLAQAAAVESDRPGAELDRRIAHEAPAAPPDVPVEIDYADAGTARLSLATALELLAELVRALGFARPLEPKDLVPPERHSALAGADPMSGEAEARATGAEEALRSAEKALADAVDAVKATPAGVDPDPAGLRFALLAAAALGVSGAFPPPPGDPAAALESLLSLVEPAAAELAAKTAALAEATTPSRRLEAVFGSDFPVLPRFGPATGLLAPALAEEPALGARADAAVEGWFAQVARVREPLDPWRQLWIYTRALGSGLRRPRIAQLPLERAADGSPPRWAALDFGAGEPHRSGLCSLALFGEVPNAGDAWSGLMLDEWPEIIPNREEDAGLAFHFDAPGTQAPQCVLLAVPPTKTDDRWSLDVVEDTLLETLDLAKLRAVEPSALDELGQLLPMAYLAANASNEAVSTRFADQTATGPTIVHRGG